MADLRAQAERLRALLANDSFTAKAPSAVVERERDRLGEIDAQLAQLEEGEARA